MSSTKRGGQRSPADDYQTPEWCVRRLMDAWSGMISSLPVLDENRWLEPCAGNGNIIRAIGKDIHSVPGAIRWKAVELREECAPELLKLLPKPAVSCPIDFFSWAKKVRTRFNVTISNPPYRLAQEFIETSLKITDGLVIMLLRVNYAGSEKRHAFFREHPPLRIFLLPNRPPFTEDGKTDSIEYAWFVWDTRQAYKVRTTFEWLDLTSLEERRGG